MTPEQALSDDSEYCSACRRLRHLSVSSGHAFRAVAVDAPSMSSTHLAAASFGGRSASFWDGTAPHIANSQHASAAANAPATVANAPVAHNASLGVFKHGAATSFAATAHAMDGYASMDALATPHIAHVETRPSHSREWPKP